MTRQDRQRYELLEVVGRGGMSTVHRAYDSVAEMEIALKVLHEHLVDDEAMVEAFEREAELMQRIDHRGVVRVFGTAEIDGRPAIAMEFCPGGDLDRRIARDGPLGEEEAIDAIACVLDALDALHSRGIIHRDIKPQNILFDDEGTPKLIDFGIGRADELMELEDAGQIGTVEYMAPERVDGLAIDARSDIYSAGVTLFEMVCGHVPYRADAASAVMRMHRNAEVPDPTVFADDLSQRLVDAIGRAMQKHPEDRFDRAQEMIDVLRGERRLRSEPAEHPFWETLKKTYGGESELVAPVEQTGYEWVVFAVDYDGFGEEEAEDFRRVLLERDQHLIVEEGPVRRVVDGLRAGTTVHDLLEEAGDDGERRAVKWRQILGSYGVARGLSRRGAEQLVAQLEEVGIVARFAQRRRRRREPTLFSRIVNPDHIAAVVAASLLFGVAVYLASIQQVEPASGMSPVMMAGFIGICVLVAVASVWASSAGMIAELWKSNFSRRYLLDFCRASTGDGRQMPVGREHVELARRIQSPRIAASFERAVNMGLWLREWFEEGGWPGGSTVDEALAGITSLARRIVELEERVGATRPAEIAARIRRLEVRIDAADDVGEIERMMDRKAELRDQLARRDRAAEKLHAMGQRCLEIAGRLERMVQERKIEADVEDDAESSEVVLEELSATLEELVVLDLESEAVVEDEAAVSAAIRGL